VIAEAMDEEAAEVSGDEGPDPTMDSIF